MSYVKWSRQILLNLVKIGFEIFGLEKWLSALVKLRTGLPIKDETLKTTQKYDELKLDFWFLHSIEYFNGLLAEKSKFGPTSVVNTLLHKLLQTRIYSGTIQFHLAINVWTILSYQFLDYDTIS